MVLVLAYDRLVPSADRGRVELERRLRARFDAGDLDAVATQALAAYGAELYGFLVAVARGDDPDELFARLCEKLWRRLPGFRWESSFRTWAYLLARYVLIDVASERAGKPAETGISDHARTLAAAARTSTPAFQRSDVKDEFVALRDQLDPDDRVLLVLRVDRDLAWREIAAVMDASEPALRKRFERVKDRLKQLARDEGLIPD
jgi:RNA polymerase sigma-70 factor, ECF subfamily